MAKRSMDVVEYDNNWISLYEIEKALISNVFKDNIVKVEHFGSTSIPKLSAKPIIDIMVLVHDINVVEQYNDEMKAIGYEARGENGMAGRRYFVKYKDDLVNHSHHVHIYQEGGNSFTDEAILFRDYLRINEQVRKKYEKIKKELSERFYNDPLAYTNGKHDCVAEILEEAKRHYVK